MLYEVITGPESLVNGNCRLQVSGQFGVPFGHDGCKNVSGQVHYPGVFAGVITSYSIHYTKLYETLNLGRGFLTVCSKFSDFGCNYRKAFAVFTSPGCLNCCVQAQQVGLPGDFFDYSYNFV